MMGRNKQNRMAVSETSDHDDNGVAADTPQVVSAVHDLLDAINRMLWMLQGKPHSREFQQYLISCVGRVKKLADEMGYDFRVMPDFRHRLRLRSQPATEVQDGTEKPEVLRPAASRIATRILSRIE